MPGRNSSNPEKRAASLANLKSPSGTTHGAHSPALVQPLRQSFLTELQEAFPNATEHELRTQAQRLAQMELYARYIDEKGVIRHRRRGEIYPAAAQLERLSASFERHNAVVLERERQHGTPDAASLKDILGELTETEAS